MNPRPVIAALALLLLASPDTALAQGGAEASGVVYFDANANGARDAGEPGVPGVGVSNGDDVVLTDAQGRYRLQVTDDTIVFVIKPSGYRLPVGRDQLPRFHYVHKPKGSPPLKHVGVAPTGPLPGSIDFALLPGERGEQFKVLVFADPQPWGQLQVDYLARDVVAELAGAQGYRFGLTLGDIVGDHPELFEPVNAVIARIGVPWFNLPGNHDLNLDATQPEHSDETYERIYGPGTYAFNEGKVHFLMLNNVLYPNRRSPAYGAYVGALSEQQLRFVANSLRLVPRDHLVVLAMHIPLYVHAGRSQVIPEDRQKLFALLQDRPYAVSLSGHTHMGSRWQLGEAAGWKGAKPHPHFSLGAVCGDWWLGQLDGDGLPDATMQDGTPNGYAVMSFDGPRYTLDWKSARAPADYHMSVYGPKVAVKNGYLSGSFYVNYFMGGDGTRVEYSVDGKAWRAMERSIEVDPTVAAHRYIWDTADRLPPGGHPSAPWPSLHLWRAKVPAEPPPGNNTITIRVTDTDGRQFFSNFTYRLVKADDPGG